MLGRRLLACVTRRLPRHALPQDMLVIIIRNNIKFTKVIVRTLKYQVIEKFIVGPARAVVDVFRLMIQAALGLPPQ